MRTAEVKINSQYLYKGKIVTVIKLCEGAYARAVFNNSGGFQIKRNRKSFILSNGLRIFSDKLRQL